MLQIKTNTDKNFEVAQSEEGISLNGESFEWDLLPLSDNKFHIIKDNKSYQAELVKADYTAKTFQMKINGQIFDLEAKDRFDLLLEKLGMADANSQKINELKAPMPGQVLQILVSAGDEIQKGDKLLILEAMKMENVLKAPGDGVVKSIEVEQGKNVEKNAVLIVFE